MAPNFMVVIYELIEQSFMSMDYVKINYITLIILKFKIP